MASKRYSLPSVKVLRGPRQVGKTSLLERLGTHQLILFDDHVIRSRAEENPSFFFDQYTGPLLLDEAILAPAIFFEIKKRVDSAKRKLRKGENIPINEQIDFWLTGSNQTLLQQFGEESLAGRAEFYNLNTLSTHELKNPQLADLMLKGGWPELHAEPNLDPVRYLNGLISTFIERDIAQASGIEKKAAFVKSLQLFAGSVGQLLNYSTIAGSTGVEVSTIQSWARLLEQNGLIAIIRPYLNNLNKRLIRSPKVFFEDVGLATRFQGWTQFEPLFLSPAFGHLLENLVYSEISRFFTNNALEKKISFVRDKEKTEIDFLLELPNQRFIAIEVKATPQDYSARQIQILESLSLPSIERWVVSFQKMSGFKNASVVALFDLFDELKSRSG